MSDVIKNIKLGETTYPVEDVTARASAETAQTTAETALNTANSKVSASYESSTSTLVLS